MDEKVVYDLLKELREDQQKQNDVLLQHTKELTYQSVSLDHLSDDLKKISQDAHNNSTNISKYISKIEVLDILQKEANTNIKNNNNKIDQLERPSKSTKRFRQKYLWWCSIIIAISSVLSLITKLVGWW